MIKYERLITDVEQQILEHYLLDIKDWIDKAIQGKINNCLKNSSNEYRTMLKQEGAESLPANDLAAFSMFVKRSDYKNRKKREDELLK